MQFVEMRFGGILLFHRFMFILIIYSQSLFKKKIRLIHQSEILLNKLSPSLNSLPKSVKNAIRLQNTFLQFTFNILCLKLSLIYS